MQKLCCVHTRQQSSASLDFLSPAYQPISPSILNHFWWVLYHLLAFTGTHVDFQTWWFHFHAFTTVWKFAAAIGKVPEVDLPVSDAASLSTTMEVGNKQKAAKKQNVITFAILTTALDSLS